MRPITTVVLVALAACGRISFDRLDTDPPLDSRPDQSLVTYREAVLADAPTAYWRLADTGATARDETGTLTGTYSTGCQATAGALASDPDLGMHFDGTSCRIVFASHFDFSGTAPFSVEVWASLDMIGTTQSLLINEERASNLPVNGFALLDSAAAGGTYFERAGMNTNRVTQLTSLTVGVFTHLVATYDGTNIQLYVDGEPFMTARMAVNAADMSATLLAIGGYPPGAGTSFTQGTIDEAAVYDHALSPARIALHHTIGTLGPQPN